MLFTVQLRTTIVQAAFSHSITRQVVRVYTGDWQAPGLQFTVSRDNQKFSLLEQISQPSFLFAGEGNTEIALELSEAPLGLSFWLEKIGESRLMPEVQFAVYLDGGLMYQLSSSEMRAGSSQLVHLPFLNQITGAHSLKFSYHLSEGVTFNLNELSTSRVFLSEDAVLLAIVSDTGHTSLTSASGDWRHIEANTWSYRPSSKEAYQFSTVARDETGNATHATFWFWQPQSQLQEVTLQQEATTSEVHALISTEGKYGWNQPLWLQADELLHDLEYQNQMYPIKRYTEPESIWTDRPTSVAAVDMFGNSRVIGELSLQE